MASGPQTRPCSISPLPATCQPSVVNMRQSKSILAWCRLGLAMLIGLGITAGLAGNGAAAESVEFDRVVGAFAQKYCLRCHNAIMQEGEFRLDTLSRDFSDPKAVGQWEEVISSRSREGQAARMAKRGPVAHYRLSRKEYQNTIYDLLGVYYDVDRPGVFNPDPLWHGYDHIGSMLSLSPSHVEHYFSAAQEILAGADLNRPVRHKTSRKEAASLRRFEDGELEQLQARLKGRGHNEPVRYLIWPGGRMSGFSSAWLSRDGSGLYRAKIQLSGLPGLNGDLPHLMVRGGSKGATKAVFDADVLAPADKPIVLEFETYMEMPASLTIFNECPGEFISKQRGAAALGNAALIGNYKETSLLNPTGFKLFTEDGRSIYPILLVDWIEWEGPILAEQMQQRRTSVYPDKNPEVEEIRTCLKNMARLAWRRPVTDAEVEPYVKLTTGEMDLGEKFDAAYQAALVGILTSSNFYNLQEGSPDLNRSQVNDWELAARLSYMLYNSMPDDELFTAAEAGKLQQPAVLRQQLERMFADPKFERFLDSFPYQWLQLHQVGMFTPNEELYPDYSPWLERSMIQETKLYFRTMLRQNRPLREFLDSDWAMLNPRLRQHYGMTSADKVGFEQVALRPEDNRGGLLTQASVLMLTSDGTRHRPVHRGVWLSEAIFNRTPPSPPPNVEPLEPTPADAPKATIRMQLQAHATHTTCASCHSKIDPLGFAFENYDAIGRWRTEEETPGKGKNPAVSAAGQLPDGRQFDGPSAFKALLVEDQDRFAVAFIEQLATYALRRVMTIDDAEQIQAIAQASQADDYRLRTVIENFVLSDLFRKR